MIANQPSPGKWQSAFHIRCYQLVTPCYKSLGYQKVLFSDKNNVNPRAFITYITFHSLKVGIPVIPKMH